MLDYNELQNYEDSLPETSNRPSKLRVYDNRNATHKNVRTRNQYRVITENYELQN